MNSNLLAAVALAVALGVGGLVLLHKPVPQMVVPPPVEHVAGSAGGGPEVNANYFSVGGARSWRYHMDMRSATSTVCSFPTPPATSTLEIASAYLTPNLGYTSVWLWGIASTPYATTTALSVVTSISNAAATGAIMATSTAGTFASYPVVVGPNTYINLALSTSSVGATFAPTGSCNAYFREI